MHDNRHGRHRALQRRASSIPSGLGSRQKETGSRKQCCLRKDFKIATLKQSRNSQTMQIQTTPACFLRWVSESQSHLTWVSKIRSAGLGTWRWAGALDSRDWRPSLIMLLPPPRGFPSCSQTWQPLPPLVPFPSLSHQLQKKALTPSWWRFQSISLSFNC